MSILDTFYILFETDADKVKLSAQQAEVAGDKAAVALKREGDAAEVAEVKVKHAQESAALGFKNLESSVDGFREKAVDSFKDIALGLIGIFAAEKLIDGVFENAEMVEQLGKTSEALNVNVSDLYAWGQAVQREGGSATDFQETIKRVNGELAQIQVMGSKARIGKFFHELGISATDANGQIKPVMELLPQLADAFQKLPHNQSSAIGMRMGLDQGTILLLQQGRNAVDEIIKKQKELGGVTQDDVEAATKFNDTLKDTKELFQLLSLNLGEAFLPVLNVVLEALNVFLETIQKHKAGAVAALAVIGGAILALIAPTLLAVGPWLLLGAAVAAVAFAVFLIGDDIANFVEGHNSLIGSAVKKWPELGAIIKDIAEIVKVLWKDFQAGSVVVLGVATDIMRYVNAIFELMVDGIVAPEKAWSNFFNNIGNAFQHLVSDLRPLLDGMEKLAKLAGFDKPGNLPTGDLATVSHGGRTPALPGSSGASSLLPSAQDVQNHAAAQQALALTNSPLMAHTQSSIAAGGAVNRTTSVTMTGDITVNTQASDPHAVAGAVSDTFSKHVQSALNHFSDGVQN